MPPPFDLICLSHLRWDFVYQRPQHLLSRFARERRVFLVEEPVYDAASPRLEVAERGQNLTIVVPHLPAGCSGSEDQAAQRSLLDVFFAKRAIRRYVLWFYTPMALPFVDHLRPLAVVYDCMDELSAFKDAPASLREREARLFRWANLVFTGGQSLFEAKRRQHARVYAFPSSVDAAHFAQAHGLLPEPTDQLAIPRPRLGFVGVLDERLDLELIAGVADGRPNWHQIFVGPVVKIDPTTLPRRPNLHYLGPKPYAELPSYLAHWDVATLPFARNAATRFISPTKTPEYLAAGVPVVSTSIRDVIRPYGDLGLARIADTPVAFIAAAEAALREEAAARQVRVDALLAETSWDATWLRMRDLVIAAAAEGSAVALVDASTVAAGAPAR